MGNTKSEQFRILKDLLTSFLKYGIEARIWEEPIHRGIRLGHYPVVQETKIKE